MDYPTYSSQDFIIAQQEVMPSLPHHSSGCLKAGRPRTAPFCEPCLTYVALCTFLLHFAHFKKEVLEIVKFLKQTRLSA